MLSSRRRSAPYEPIVAPVLQGSRYGGKPVYFSDVIVRSGSDIASFAELRGRSFAVNEPASHSGYGVVRYKLVSMGETSGFFDSVVESGAHMNSIAMVAGGEVDAAAIDSHVLELEMRDRPELAEQLRVVASLGPSTIQPVVAAAHVPPEMREAVRSAFLSMGDTAETSEILARGLTERFVEAGRGSYDDVRAMVKAAEDAHFLVLK